MNKLEKLIYEELVNLDKEYKEHEKQRDDFKINRVLYAKSILLRILEQNLDKTNEPNKPI